MSLLSFLVRFFEGRVKIYADSENKDAFVSFLVESEINARVLPEREKDGIYTEISPGTLKKIAPALDKLNIMVYIIDIYGFKRFSSRYGKRYGLWFGFSLFAVLLWISTLFVWRVDVNGTELLSKEQVRAELSEMGVRVGVRISDIDRSSVSNSFLKEHPELSWAALNFKGTTAILILKETEEKPDSGEKTESRLMVAAESGVVRSVTVSEGKAAVKVGTVVNKGDVLISGLISGSGAQITDSPSLRVTNACGSVKAEVVRKASVSIPFNEVFYRTEEGGKRVKVISVFGHDFSFGKTEGKVLLDERSVTFFGVVEIPVTVKTYSEELTVTDTVSRDGEAARLEAERQLYKKITEMLGDGELTYVKAEYTETENGIVGQAEIGCVTEIAVPYKGFLKAE